jgi:hypothetical protein
MEAMSSWLRVGRTKTISHVDAETGLRCGAVVGRDFLQRLKQGKEVAMPVQSCNLDGK